MHDIALTWQQAALLASGLFAVAVTLNVTGRGPAPAAPAPRRLAPFAREAGLIAALYALWQLAGSLSVLGTSGAFDRARAIVRLEHDWRLPSEADVQHLVLAHPLLAQACNLYYATMHFGVLFAFLLWLFVRHPGEYPRVRTTLVLLTAVSLLVQLVPVAPPRLLPGFVDTAEQYGQSVYGLGVAADQLSAMPSVHVGWALLIGWAVVRISSSRWRWLALAHPALTVFVVVATANHFWLDGILAAVVLVLCVGIQRATGAAWAALRAREGRKAYVVETPERVAADAHPGRPLGQPAQAPD